MNFIWDPRPGLLLVSLAMMSGATACSFRGGVGSGYACGDDEACPIGQSCVAGYCSFIAPPDGAVPRDDGGNPIDGHVGDDDDDDDDDDLTIIDGGGGGLDGSVDIDAAASFPDAGGPTIVHCGNLGVLRDGFDGGGIAGFWGTTASGGVTTSETGGALVINLPAGAGAGGTGNVYSEFKYDFTGGMLDVQVSQVGGESTAIEVIGGGTTVRLEVTGGVLRATVDDDIKASTAYSPTEHRFWRLREANGVLHWETSADRSSWSVLFGAFLPFDGTEVTARIGASGRLAAAGQARFEDVNVASPSDPGLCTTSSIDEQFDSVPLEPVWLQFSAGCGISETGGKARFAASASSSGQFCGIATQHTFDLRNSTLLIDASGIAGLSGFLTTFSLIGQETDAQRLLISRDGNVWHAEQVGGASVDLAYDTTNHHFWRFAASGSTVRFETSANASTWTTRLETTPTFDISAVYVDFVNLRTSSGGAITVEVERID